MDNYNPETVGTAETSAAENTCGQLCSHATYGQVIEHLRGGGMASREGWNGKGMFIFRQVPSKVPAEVVPKMSSLPEAVKAEFAIQGISPHYQNQMVIVKPDGSIDSWVASSSDTFAMDWLLL